MSNPTSRESDDRYGDWCRHCHFRGRLTHEHVPARSAGNNADLRIVDDTGAVLAAFADGHAIPVLCRRCNEGAGQRRLPLAYKLWREDIVKGIRQVARQQRLRRPFDVWGSDVDIEVAHGYNLHPGRIARQCLGMVLAVQQTTGLRDDWPLLLDAYQSDADGTTTEPLSLHVALYNANFGYFTDAAHSVTLNLTGNKTASARTRFWTIGFAPFLIALVEGPDAPWPSRRIDEWLVHSTRYHFRKADRDVSYPIADRSHPLVAKIYDDTVRHQTRTTAARPVEA